jgi:hypothetical protein
MSARFAEVPSLPRQRVATALRPSPRNLTQAHKQTLVWKDNQLDQPPAKFDDVDAPETPRLAHHARAFHLPDVGLPAR